MIIIGVVPVNSFFFAGVSIEMKSLFKEVLRSGPFPEWRSQHFLQTSCDHFNLKGSYREGSLYVLGSCLWANAPFEINIGDIFYKYYYFGCKKLQS